MTVGPRGYQRGPAPEARISPLEHQEPPGPTRAAIGAGVLTLVVLAVLWQSAGPGASPLSIAGAPPVGVAPVPTVPFADAVAQRATIEVPPGAPSERPVRVDLVDAEMLRVRRSLILGDTPGAVDRLLLATLRLGDGPERALLLERAVALVEDPGGVPPGTVGALEGVIGRLAARTDTDPGTSEVPDGG